MSKQRLWTEEETKKLERLYTSESTFDEIVNALPKRTANAIRLKASRLGLRRPIVSSSLCKSQTVLRCSNGNEESEEYLFKCDGCGNWIHVSLNDEDEDLVIVCQRCHNTYRYVT